MDAMSMTGGSDASIPDFLKPGASYIPPSGGFFFGHMGEMPSFERMLPTREAGDRLIQQYFIAVHPVARCVHRPSFEADYQSFWDEIYNNYEPRASTQAVMFAAWFSAAVSMDEQTIRRDFAFDKHLLIEKLKHATEVSLSKANFLRTTRVETMQGFIMYMVMFGHLTPTTCRSLSNVRAASFMQSGGVEGSFRPRRCRRQDGRVHGPAQGWRDIRTKPAGHACPQAHLASTMLLGYPNL
jgi:hypothetical protein